jgi:hypothetical protein
MAVQAGCVGHAGHWARSSDACSSDGAGAALDGAGVAAMAAGGGGACRRSRFWAQPGQRDDSRSRTRSDGRSGSRTSVRGTPDAAAAVRTGNDRRATVNL